MNEMNPVTRRHRELMSLRPAATPRHLSEEQREEGGEMVDKVVRVGEKRANGVEGKGREGRGRGFR